jgi:hypothetical protein
VVGAGTVVFPASTPARTSTGWYIESRYLVGAAGDVDVEAATTASLHARRGGHLLGVGAEVVVRCPLSADAAGSVQPYLLAGVGWRVYLALDVPRDESLWGGGVHAAEAPVGLGVSYGRGNFVADLRGVVRVAGTIGLPLASEVGGDASMHRLELGVVLGHRWR